MLPNLLAELAGVSLEIGIAILVIERVASAHRRRQWSSAYGGLSDRAAMTFVDRGKVSSDGGVWWLSGPWDPRDCQSSRVAS